MTKPLIHTTIKSPVIAIIIFILFLILLWYIYYRNIIIEYSNQNVQLWSNLYNINYAFHMIGITFIIIIIIGFFILGIKNKELMTTSTATTKSTDPMVISQTTAGAIKTIHDQLEPIQITQDIIDQLMDAVNNQTDQISALQQNSN